MILFLGAALTVTAGNASAQSKNVKLVPVQPTMTMAGSDLYRQYCAACHGADGKGAGPAADALKEHPSDLTLIARQNNGKFPALQVKLVILGQSRVVAHGTEDMPTWGDLFRSLSPDNKYVEMRVQAVLNYLEKIQR